MNIGINLLWLLRNYGSGVSVYAQNLLDNLFAIDKKNKYYLLINLYNYRNLKKKYKKNKNVELKVIDIRYDFIFNPLKAVIKLIARLKKDDLFKEEITKREIQKIINKKKLDILFFLSGIIYPKSLLNIKKIVTIYDLQHEYFPQNFSEKVLEYRKNIYQYTVLNSDHIIAISDYTKKTIIEKYKINSDKITTVYLGAEAREDVKSKLRLPQNFIFYPATFWPHKNHLILIKALKELRPQFPDLNLIFTGAIKNTKLKKEIDDLISFYNLCDRVIYLGYVSEDDLSHIYRKARALIFPSSFEGFGLPIIEAFKQNLPVIAANNSSIGEIVNSAGLLFETNNLEMLVPQIKKILSDSGLRENLISKGRERAKIFTWENTAKETISVFNKVFHGV